MKERRYPGEYKPTVEAPEDLALDPYVLLIIFGVIAAFVFFLFR